MTAAEIAEGEQQICCKVMKVETVDTGRIVCGRRYVTTLIYAEIGPDIGPELLSIYKEG